MIDAEDRVYIARGALIVVASIAGVLSSAVVIGLSVGIVRMLGGF